jgi:hypothetical protein
MTPVRRPSSSDFWRSQAFPFTVGGLAEARLGLQQFFERAVDELDIVRIETRPTGYVAPD